LPAGDAAGQGTRSQPLAQFPKRWSLPLHRSVCPSWSVRNSRERRLRPATFLMRGPRRQLGRGAAPSARHPVAVVRGSDGSGWMGRVRGSQEDGNLGAVQALGLLGASSDRAYRSGVKPQRAARAGRRATPAGRHSDFDRAVDHAGGFPSGRGGRPVEGSGDEKHGTVDDGRESLLVNQVRVWSPTPC